MKKYYLTLFFIYKFFSLEQQKYQNNNNTIIVLSAISANTPLRMYHIGGEIFLRDGYSEKCMVCFF